MGRFPLRIAFVILLLSAPWPLVAAPPSARASGPRPAVPAAPVPAAASSLAPAQAPERARRAPPSMPAMPVVSGALGVRAAALDAGAPIRVIVTLDAAPARRLEREARADEAAALASLKARVRAEVLRQSRRDAASPPPRDADRRAELRRRAPADRAALRPLAQEREQIELRIQRAKARALRASLAPAHERVAAALRELGGDDVRSLWVGNALVVNLPAGRVQDAADIRGVARLSVGELETGHLTNVDEATLASAPGGLWAGGATGGTFDPAIIDSGVDRTNPLMVDTMGYTNFWAVSLTAGQNDPNWADGLDEDDRHGHGTHVQGIVASHGSASYPAHLGLAYGVSKVVQLKAGFCCTAGGNTAMYPDDRMAAVDLALMTPALLDSAAGTGTFSDDVDGFNVSYGAQTLLDDTDASRFIDGVIDAWSDTPITISAGNTGPFNPHFNSPANAYNAITVANVDDQGTATRADDLIAPSSSRGPTEDGRRKPDLAAPGTAISAPNDAWETEVDVIDRTGTSMAAPMVLGVLMDLMEAGVTDELELKALLINTAQKNDGAIDFDSDLDDADGWHPAYGWGYMNTLAAYDHRVDVRKGTITEDGQPGDYALYSGTMRDEGSTGEGRDRATLVWNRHADWNGSSEPTTYYALNDLDLRLYDAATGELIDEDVTAIDNVHQVRIDEAASETPVVIRVDTASVAFPSGDASESFALATEEGFVAAPLPSLFAAVANWPSSVEPGEQFQVEFWVRNDDDLPSHANSFDLDLPPGFTLDAGADPFGVGSVAGGATESLHAIWTVTAAGPDGPVSIGVDHSHTSYLEPWGAGALGDWNLPLDVVTDTTPPVPGMSSFASSPAELSTTQLVMQAAPATDADHAPVSYFFDFVSSPSGGAGGLDRDWATSPTYVNNDLEPNHEYCYAVRARDAAVVPNETIASPSDCDYTEIESPAVIEFGSVTSTSIEARSGTALSNLALGGSGVRISNDTIMGDSGWLTTNAFWASAPLLPNTPYAFTARARNGDGAETSDSAPALRYTHALPPLAVGFGAIAEDSIEVLFDGGANPAGTELQAENSTNPGTSPWQTATSWVQPGLGPNSTHAFVVRARNGDGVPTGDVAVGSATTWAAVPSGGTIGAVSQAGATASWDVGGNPLGTEFEVENTTTMTSSGWIPVASHPEASLLANTAYALRVRARNADAVPTDWLDLPVFHTLADDPLPLPVGPSTAFSIEVNFDAASNPPGTEYLVENQTAATDSGWITATTWLSDGLVPSTSYDFRVKARNGDDVETGWVALDSASTWLAPPLPGLAWSARIVLVVAMLGVAASVRARTRSA